ncbi:hypothetical protein [Bacillus sp. FSL K6-3431]|uniref:hypothetical protein n=1 Tax=Bacillus sp. FSL K6-3431 TaxID=2921500 RepID=UPI0030FB853F
MTKDDCLKKLERIEFRLQQLEKMLEEKLDNERNTIVSSMEENKYRMENKLQYLELASKEKIQRVS